MGKVSPEQWATAQPLLDLDHKENGEMDTVNIRGVYNKRRAEIRGYLQHPPSESAVLQDVLKLSHSMPTLRRWDMIFGCRTT